MNYVIELIKLFGSKKQKINALKFDNEKMSDEIRYISSVLESKDADETTFYINKIEYLQHVIYSNNEKIKRLSL